MLILTRRAEEKLVIGDNVTITVLAVKGKQVLIGVQAPREIPVHREEIYQRILEGRAAETGLAADGPHSGGENSTGSISSTASRSELSSKKASDAERRHSLPVL